MSLTRQEVDDIALLARLHLDDAEANRMQEDLAAILAHFDVLASVDTEGVAPMLHAVPMDLPLRDDVSGPSLPVAAALAAAPARDGDYLVVPAIIPGAE